MLFFRNRKNAGCRRSKQRTQACQQTSLARLRPLRVESLEDRRMLAIIMVNSLDDGPVNLEDGSTTLRDAIALAADESAYPGADEIVFDSKLDLASSAGIITLTDGALVIDSALTITGPGAAQLTIDAKQQSRVMTIGDPSSSDGVDTEITISCLTVTGGGEGEAGDSQSQQIGGGGIWSNAMLTLDGVTVTENSASFGGGIRNDHGTMLINHCKLLGNIAKYNGGAISNDRELTIFDSVISGNSSLDQDGGGISNYGGGHLASLTIVNSTISDNTAVFGGGISNGCSYSSGSATSLAFTECTFSNNSAGTGGGIYNQSFNGNDTTITVKNSTFLGNSARDGGGIYSRYSGSGNVTLTIKNSTFWANSSSFNGAGIYCSDSRSKSSGKKGHTTLELTNSTISANISRNGGGGIYCCGAGATIKMNNTIVAGNEARSRTADIYCDSNCTQLGAYNLIGNGTTLDLRNGEDGNKIGTYTMPLNPMLSDWGQVDNGKWGYCILPGSPVIDAGNSAFATTSTDIYGYPRVSGYSIDIGAVEGATPDNPARIYVVTSLENTIAEDGVLTFLEAFEAANRNQPVGDALAGSAGKQDTIRFAGSLFDTGQKTIQINNGSLDIVGDFCIEGPGAEFLIFDAYQQNQVFSINHNVTVNLSGIAITGGTAKQGGGIYNKFGELIITNSIISNNSASDDGGGIYNYCGRLDVTNSTISNNSADDDGGGVYNYSDDKTAAMTIVGSTFLCNVAGGTGGGVYDYDGDMKIMQSAFRGNSSTLCGGGIYDYDGESIIVQSTFVGNSAASGGGIYIYQATLDLINATVVENLIKYPESEDTALEYSFSDSVGGGGGACNASGSLTVANSIISQNREYATSTFSNVSGSVSAVSTHNLLNEDPKFVRQPSSGEDGEWGIGVEQPLFCKIG